MKKQSIDKLNMFLMGLQNRSLENRDFFKQVAIVFKSGKKQFKGKVTLKKDLFNMNFNGKNQEGSFEEICNMIKHEAKNYDSLKIDYMERGTTIVIEGDDKGINIKYTDNNDVIKEIDNYTASQIKERDYYIKVGKANDLLMEIGILTKEGKIKNDMIRKYNQIDHFVELIDKLLKDLDTKDTITIVDCGCGKSYLSFVLNYYIKEVLRKNCQFIGIDNSENVIEASQKMAQNLGYRNMKFINEDLCAYTPEEDIDIVMSLHACDTATDMALALGVRANAKAIISVPCCHKEFLSQYSYDELSPILKHGVFKARFADIMTDGLRTLLLEGYGYEVSPVEYISPLDTPKNLMLRCIKTTDENPKAMEEYRRIKSLFNVRPTFESLVY